MYVVDWEFFHDEMMAVNHATVLPVNDEFLKAFPEYGKHNLQKILRFAITHETLSGFDHSK